MRPITTHVVEGDKSAQVEIHAVDDETILPGGANHWYTIHYGNVVDLEFQRGNVITTNMETGEVTGLNGITIEALIAISLDRLQGFQKGPYNSAYNATAIGHLQQALSQLQQRTKDRVARGVEGTHTK